MSSFVFRVFLLAVVVFFDFCLSAQAQYLDQIGVKALRAVTTNLSGAGIPVAQAEAAAPYFQVNPAAVGQPVALFVYVVSNMTATTFPNSLGVESQHADDVANQFYGITNGVATNVAKVYNYDANELINKYIFSTPTHNANAAVVNQSFTFGQQPVAQQQQLDDGYDDYSVTYKTLFVSPANNYGNYNPPTSYNTTNVAAPGTAYNCICVGAYQNGVSYNSLGPTLDNGRCKPDITALSGATSYSTPQIAGAAAVLMQAALRGDGGSDTNSAADIRTLKALLLNGAVKPANWTNSTSFPLDARYGAGVLNVFNAYQQLAGGKHGSIVSNLVSAGSAHPPTGATGTVSALVGWDFRTNTSTKKSGPNSDSIHHYYFNVSNATDFVRFTATATLVWNRQSGQSSINDLDLALYNCADSNVVAESVSYVNNVEHLCITNLAQGRYDLQVWKAGGSGIVSASEPYALAWQFVPPPILSASSDGMDAVLTWPLYPAGFKVEARTNLMTGVWSTNNLPGASIANGQNTLLLQATQEAQFFRLRQVP